MQPHYYHDSVETKLIYQQSALIEAMRELRAEMCAKLRDEFMFFGISEYCRYERELNKLKREMEIILNQRTSSEIMSFYKKYNYFTPTLYLCQIKEN